MQRISFQVSHATLANLMDEARKGDLSVGQLLRDAVQRELHRRRASGKRPRKADERLVARLGALLGPGFAEADSWETLQENLRAAGHELRPAGGGLALHETGGGERLCKASELGYPYSRLISRFGAAFPGHSHRHLVERLLGTEEAASEEDDDFDVIERTAPTRSPLPPRASGWS